MSNIEASESTEPKKSSEVNLEEEAASEEPDQPWEPTTSDDVLQYLRENLVNSFADADFRQSLLFEDALEGVSGAYRLAVAESLWDGKPCFVVEGHSRGIANGVKWNSVLTATVEIPSLGTVRQKRIFKAESCVEGSVGDEPLDAVECLTNVEMLKRPYTPVEEPPKEGGEGEDEEEPKVVGEGESVEEPPPVPMHVTYRVSKALKHHDDKEESERVLSEEESGRFFPEGALAILLRCLVKMRFENLSIPLELVDFDPEFELCPMTCLRIDDAGNTGHVADDFFHFLIRHAHSDDVVYDVTTHHLATGAVVFRKQDEPFMELHLPSEEPPLETGPSSRSVAQEKPTFEKRDLVMEEDLELFSKYQDRMDELKASHGTYLRQHPELKTIMSDFLQEVLTMKPGKFLPFAASYFATFRQAEQTSRKPSQASKASKVSTAASGTPICVCDTPEPEDCPVLFEPVDF